MNMKELSKYSGEQLDAIMLEMDMRGNFNAANMICYFKKYYHKNVTVVRGRKVPKGTVGEVFWMNAYNNSKYQDLWGIYTTIRIGIRTSSDQVYWTNLDNVELTK